MAIVNRFEELIYWQKARFLSGEVHQMTRDENFQDNFDLKHQLRRSAGSVMDNIAIGFSRGGIDDFAQFVGVARGSLAELKSQLYRSLDNAYISQSIFDGMYGKTDEVDRIVDSLFRMLNDPNRPGKGNPKEASNDK